jgi:hypothetical protein
MEPIKTEESDKNSFEGTPSPEKNHHSEPKDSASDLPDEAALADDKAFEEDAD